MLTQEESRALRRIARTRVVVNVLGVVFFALISIAIIEAAVGAPQSSTPFVSKLLPTLVLLWVGVAIFASVAFRCMCPRCGHRFFKKHSGFGGAQTWATTCRNCGLSLHEN